MTDDLQKFLDELRSRLSIADIIGQKVKLTKRGREYTGLCPFHHEKTPSFTINESKGFYHCFGCGAHGDIVRFVMESDGLPFIEAVKKLADKAGLQMPAFSKESQEQSQKRKSLYEIMDMAAAFFEKNLRMPIGAYGLRYFKEKRGLSDEIIQKFRLGYAPNNNGLKALLTSKGVSEQDMAELGLIAVPEDKSRPSHDFFRDRVMIPIMDKQGNIIAFGGRIMDNSQPKYLNSPETPIFNKRRILYNMTHAREPAYQNKRLIICEGYMDVIALDSFGFNYAVAPLGTALTEEQVLEAWKVCPNPILCFDGDGAGIKAAIRSIDRVLPILRAGYSVSYIFLKEKKDPDELLHTLGPAVFEQYLQRAKPLVDILWHKCKMNKDSSTPEQKALIEKEVYEEVGKIKDAQIRSYYAQEMKQRIYYTFGRGAQIKQQPTPSSNNSDQPNIISERMVGSKAKHTYNLVKKPPLTDLDLRNIVAAMLLYPELIGQYEERLSSFEIGRSAMAKILLDIIEIHQEEEHLDSDILLEKVKLNFIGEIGDLWELNMYRQQKLSMSELNAQINNSLTVIQLKQIDADIKECMNLMQNQPADLEEINSRYQQLIKERNALILSQE
ncbi:MAG: DNA primase [Alphaproteobacteria bacterium]|nr:DNA primase [Alphaproteobacteria bacterium]